MIRRYIIGFITLSLSIHNGYCQDDTDASPAYNPLEYSYPGGIAEIIIEKQSTDIPNIRFGIREPIIIDQGDSWRILIGLDLNTLPGEYLLYIKSADKDSRATHRAFEVRQKAYPVSELDKNNNKRINQTVKSFSEIEFNNTQQPNLPLILPIKAEWEDGFGTLYYKNDNKKPISHNLLTLKTEKNSLVLAPQNAIISKIEFNKQEIATVYLDHGRGLYSIITGIRDLTIEAGNGVVSGAVIGKVAPATLDKRFGQLTWQCIINGVYVNPLILTKLPKTIQTNN